MTGAEDRMSPDFEERWWDFVRRYEAGKAEAAAAAAEPATPGPKNAESMTQPSRLHLRKEN
jgi:hypothetical protein